MEPHVSSLGYGGDVTTNLTERLNLVFSASGANYPFLTLGPTGVTYQLNYRPRTAELRAQIFPLSGPRTHSLFVTAGAVLTTHAFVTGKMTAAPGAAFSFNGVPYTNSRTDPMYSTVGFGSGRLAYTFGLGYGNVLRTSRRWSIPMEIGVVALGESIARVYPAGSVCESDGETCRLISSDPVVLSNQLAEAQREANRHKSLQYAPIVTIGIAYRFGRRSW